MEAAQRLVDRDYAGRLVLSHGLYHSPYPVGSYVLCEVFSGSKFASFCLESLGILLFCICFLAYYGYLFRYYMTITRILLQSID